MSTVRELARDSIFSSVVYLAPRLANVLLFILIGRLAGPAEGRNFALATTYLIIFTTFMRGQDELIIREVARQPNDARAYLTSFLTIRLSLSIGLYIVLWLVVRLVLRYPVETAVPILIVTLSLIPDSLSYVAQSVMLGRRIFFIPAIGMTAASVIKSIVGGILIFRGQSLELVAWSWFLGSLVGMLVLLAATFYLLSKDQVGIWLNWKVLNHPWYLILPFFVITILTTLETQTDTVLLSLFHGEATVGWYNAATTLAYSLALLSQSYRFSVYPLMARYARDSTPKLARLYEQSLRLLGTLVLPMSTGLALLATPIVLLIYGPEFTPSANVLQILSAVLVFLFLNVPTSRALYVYDRQGKLMTFLVISVVVNVILNLILDPQWGAKGTAVARLTSSFIYFLVAYLYVEKNLLQSNLLRLLSRPLLATLVMGVVVWLIHDQSLLLSIPVSVVTYVLVLWFAGGISAADLAILRRAFGMRQI